MIPQPVKRKDARKGQTLIEALVALFIIVLVITMLYQALIVGSFASASNRARLVAQDFINMQKEQIASTPYKDIPPEIHTLMSAEDTDGMRSCAVQLRHKPIRNTIDVWFESGVAIPNQYTWSCDGNKIVFPQELSGRKVIINYAYEYPRCALFTVPSDPPYHIKPGGSLREVNSVVYAGDKPVPAPVALDLEKGLLRFKPQDAGRTVAIEYRGEKDKGRVECSLLKEDLSSLSSVDKGLKLVILTESWTYNGQERSTKISYVRAK